MIRLILAASALLLALAPAASAEDLRKSRHLWATVNACDTEANPDAIGLRASMPGSGRRGEALWMRFRVQHRLNGAWTVLPEGGDSGFVRVGHARYKARQSGWVFPFMPEAGRNYRLRGIVTFEWRKGTRVVLRKTERTTADHNVTEADPEGYSAASCVISG